MSTAIETIRLHPGAQTKMASSSADITIGGGEAGGGKTFWLLAECLRHIGNPNHKAIITRNSGTELTDQGGLWDESMQLYPLFNGKPNSQYLRWTFPTKASIRFRHLENRNYVSEWKGTQVSLLCMDQVEDCPEDMFWYITSRVRSTSGIRPYIRATCNPDPDSWLCKFLEWWIDQKTGYPIPERDGILRWMVRDKDDVVQWADSAQELAEKYPKSKPMSVTFIRSRAEDNLTLMEMDPDYITKLENLPKAHRMRLRGGNWKYRSDATRAFDPDWFDDVFWPPDPESEAAAIYHPDMHDSLGWPINIRWMILVADTSFGTDYQCCWAMGANGDGKIYCEAIMTRGPERAFGVKILDMGLRVPRHPQACWIEEPKNKFESGGSLQKAIAKMASTRGVGFTLKNIPIQEHQFERMPKGEVKEHRIKTLQEPLEMGIFRFINTPDTQLAVSQIREYRLDNRSRKQHDDAPDCLARGMAKFRELANSVRRRTR